LILFTLWKLIKIVGTKIVVLYSNIKERNGKFHRPGTEIIMKAANYADPIFKVIEKRYYLFIRKSKMAGKIPVL
jgi:hypothetical protein